ncbi:hypothetical protein [Pseudanabaena sp. PCC 6802]|uniref:hypothetical protein n=1 Tax=Pseudanabaena sp. PCC 6802 TaxID=118173 RepID=UPI00034AFD35|nr:hypothetical protein [Pseudanabaena sp. PCC 6802]
MFISSQKAKKDYLLDSHFERSFTLSLVAIALLTFALPIFISTNQVAPGSAIEPTTSIKSIPK